MAPKNRAFTLVESFVVFAIVGILVAISAPQWGKMIADQKFESEISDLNWTILDARTNAISEKICDGSEPKSWGVKVEIPDKYTLFCEKIDGTQKIVQDFKFESSRIESLNFSNAQSFPASPEVGSFVEISFFSGQKNNISIKKQGEKFRRKLKIILKRMSKTGTICFDRIAGFPTISHDENCAE